MVKQIDLKAVIADKNPTLARRMPGFLLSYLNRILHVGEINEFLRKHHADEGMVFAEAGIQYLDLHFNITGIERLKAEDRPIIVSNHPLGGLDGIAMLTVVGRQLGSVKLLVNDFLMNITNLRSMFVPVNKHGSNRAYKSQIDRVVAGDDPLIIFPAGVCSRKLSYGIYDLEWNKSFIKMARNSGRKVVPAFSGGRNSNFFYNLANIRRKLKIRSNIEMLYLVNEMVKQRHVTLDMIFGTPIPGETFTDTYSDWLWARHLREHVYRLRDEPGAVFDTGAKLTLPESYFG